MLNTARIDPPALPATEEAMQADAAAAEQEAREYTAAYTAGRGDAHAAWDAAAEDGRVLVHIGCLMDTVLRARTGQPWTLAGRYDPQGPTAPHETEGYLDGLEEQLQEWQRELLARGEKE